MGFLNHQQYHKNLPGALNIIIIYHRYHHSEVDPVWAPHWFLFEPENPQKQLVLNFCLGSFSFHPRGRVGTALLHLMPWNLICFPSPGFSGADFEVLEFHDSLLVS